MELIKNYESKAVCELRTIAEYFEKRHDHILRNIETILADDESLNNEFISILYEDKSGKHNRTYLVTELGFFLLVSSFKGKKAIKWKTEFYKQYKQMQEHIKQLNTENTILKQLVEALELNPLMGRATIGGICEHIKQLNTENTITKHLLSEYEQCTYCISDICCKFENLNPIGANEYLLDRGVIEKRASGYYPSLDYLHQNLLISATCLGADGFVNYVRYTPLGVEHVTNMFIKNGYKLKEV